MSRYIPLDEALYRHWKEGHPVMPLLLPYCDNHLYEAYAGRYNVEFLTGGASEREEIQLLNKTANDLWKRDQKPGYKYVAVATQRFFQ